MTDSVFIFTFGPIQSFIAEARRAADLYTGSQVLVELAKAAAIAIGTERLVYPALDEKGNLPFDIPNKLVARVPWDDCETVAKEARSALLLHWHKLAKKASEAFLSKANLPFDPKIWERQTGDDYVWETYWSAANIENGDYKTAYAQAEQGLVALKFTRPFRQFLEPGFKDTLSGRREALHHEGQDGRKYWLEVGNIKTITPIIIRPSTETRPRERLDAIGIIKRFHPELSEKAVNPFHGFPSTSSIASWSFLDSAKAHGAAFLKDYRDAIQRLLPEKKYKIRDDDSWYFDGDLFYLETLRPKRMDGDYGKKETDYSAEDLKTAQARLQDLYRALKKAAKDKKDSVIHPIPSPYYAIIALDGDGMGKYLRTLDEQGHANFSQKLREFSEAVQETAANYRARVIYNGGDDVLAFAPLDTAIPFTHALADKFHEKTTRTASAGIVIAHHLAPLGTALQTARRAEGIAKALRDEKNALCVIALKRSGEPIEVCTAWESMSPFAKIVENFVNDNLASRLPYDLARSAYALPEADEMFTSELRRLLKRHWQGAKGERDEQAQNISLELGGWAKSFPEKPTTQLAEWLALARFVAKGGRE